MEAALLGQRMYATTLQQAATQATGTDGNNFGSDLTHRAVLSALHTVADRES